MAGTVASYRSEPRLAAQMRRRVGRRGKSVARISEHGWAPEHPGRNAAGAETEPGRGRARGGACRGREAVRDGSLVGGAPPPSLLACPSRSLWPSSPTTACPCSSCPTTRSPETRRMPDPSSVVIANTSSLQYLHQCGLVAMAQSGLARLSQNAERHGNTSRVSISST